MDKETQIWYVIVFVAGIIMVGASAYHNQDGGNEDVLEPFDCVQTNKKFEELFNTTFTGNLINRVGSYNKPIMIDSENNRYVAIDYIFLDRTECTTPGCKTHARLLPSPNASDVTIYHKSGGIFYGSLMDLYHDRYYGRAVQDNGSIFAIDDAFDTVINYTALELRLNKERDDCYTYPNSTYSVLDVTKRIRCDEDCHCVYDVCYSLNNSHGGVRYGNVRLPSDVRRDSTITQNLAEVYISQNTSKLVLVEVYNEHGGYTRYTWELHVTPEMMGYDDWVREAMQ